MAYPVEKRAMSAAEYRALDLDSGVKHEFINGEAYAMSGGTSEHARIVMNLGVAVGARLKGKPCWPTSSEQRVSVPETGGFFYADLTVVCGGYEHHPEDPNALVNPTLLVEVLSPSTADYDQGTKFRHYERLSSLRDYVLVSQEERRVDVWSRVEDGWLRRTVLEGEARFGSLGISIPLDEIYDLEGVRPE